MMKNIAIILVVLLMGITTGCKKDEIEKLHQENEELSQQIEKKDSTINALRNFNDKIEKNLQSVAQRVSGLDTLSFEGLSQDEISERLKELNKVISTKEEKGESLENKLRGARYQAQQYKEKINQLKDETGKLKDSLQVINNELMAKTERVEELLSEKEDQDATISKLREQNKAYRDSLREKKEQLNTVYVTVGPENELKEKDIVMKKGGFLGFIGQTAVLDPEFNQSDFNAYGISGKDSVTIEAKRRKVEVVTQHPEDAYDLEEKGNETTVLNITEPEEFWRAGKYLVITY
ncbi:MAG: hypothetical protein ACLFM7_12575 [Bacteroidales bacterium]